METSFTIYPSRKTYLETSEFQLMEMYVSSRFAMTAHVAMKEWCVMRAVDREEQERVPVVSDLEKAFSESADKWRRETRGYSTLLHKAMNEHYLDIIGMGQQVIPFILRDLKRKPDHWFIALKHIAKVDPVKKEDLGDIRKMTDAWLVWGRQMGYIA